MYAYQCVLVYELLSSQQSPVSHSTPEVSLMSEMPVVSPRAGLGLNTHNNMGTFPETSTFVHPQELSNTIRRQTVHHVHSALLAHHAIFSPDPCMHHLYL